MWFWAKYNYEPRDIIELLKSQKMDPDAHMAKLPAFGITVGIPQTTKPAAAGFFRTVEGDKHTVILDSLITNSELPAETRDLALNDVVSRLIDWAKDHDITNILAFSTDKNTLMRANRFGFVELPHQVISLSLS